MPTPPYYALASQYGNQYGVDPNLVEAVMERESGGNPNAVSPAGAQGLMQMMPSHGLHHPFDPNENVKAGTEFLAQLMREFHGNIGKTLAGYNAGPGAVERYGGVPPYAETQKYVKNVEETYGELGGRVPQDGLNWDVLTGEQRHDNFAKVIGPTVTHSFLSSITEALASAQPWETIWDIFNKGKSYYAKPKS